MWQNFVWNAMCAISYLAGGAVATWVAIAVYQASCSLAVDDAVEDANNAWGDAYADGFSDGYNGGWEDGHRHGLEVVNRSITELADDATKESDGYEWGA